MRAGEHVAGSEPTEAERAAYTSFLKACGGRIVELREAAGMSRQDLAAASGVDAVTLGTYERGSRLVLENALRLAAALNVPVQAIVCDPADTSDSNLLQIGRALPHMSEDARRVLVRLALLLRDK